MGENAINSTDVRHHTQTIFEVKCDNGGLHVFQQLAVLRLTFQCEKGGRGCFGDNGGLCVVRGRIIKFDHDERTFMATGNGRQGK